MILGSACGFSLIRRANQFRLFNNSRFLVLPWVRVPNLLTTHALALVLRAVTWNWKLSA